jgi:hypothetical protein
VISAAADGDGQVVKKALTGEFEEASMLSGDTVSTVVDPVDVWLLSSPVEDGWASPRLQEMESMVEVEEEVVPHMEAMQELNPSSELLVEEVRGAAPVPKSKEAAIVLDKAAPVVVKGRRTKTVVVKASGAGQASTRKSARNRSASANPTMAKAQQCMAERNLEKGNSFTVLDSISDVHLWTIDSDSYVVFTPSASTPVEVLSLIRARD